MAATLSFSVDANQNIVVSDVGGTLGAGPALTYSVQPPHKWASKVEYAGQLRDFLRAYSQWLHDRLMADSVVVAADASTFSLAAGQVAEPSF